MIISGFRGKVMVDGKEVQINGEWKVTIVTDYNSSPPTRWERAAIVAERLRSKLWLWAMTIEGYSSIEEDKLMPYQKDFQFAAWQAAAGYRFRERWFETMSPKTLQFWRRNG